MASRGSTATPAPAPAASDDTTAGKKKGEISYPSETLLKLRELNAEGCAVVNHHGRTVVAREVYDPVLKHRTLEYQSLQDFAAFYRNQRVMLWDERGRKAIASLGDAWLDWRNHKTYTGVCFDPSPDQDHTPAGFLNMWRGLNASSIPGDWSLFRNLVEEVICDGNKEYSDFFFATIAQALVEPHKPPGVAIVLISEEKGTGKTTTAEYCRLLFGAYGKMTASPQNLVGQFNSTLENTILLVLEEAIAPGNRQHAMRLKSIITDATISIERKGFEPYQAKNFLRIIMCSNEPHVVPASMDERRFFVLQVNTKRRQDHKYFGALRIQMDNGGLDAMLYDLLDNYDRDYRHINLRNPPQTAALAQQKLASMDAKCLWLLRKLETGELIAGSGQWGDGNRQGRIDVDALVRDYLAGTKWEEKGKGESLQSASVTVGRFLRKVFRESELRYTRQRPASGSGPFQVAVPSKYIFAPLPVCRAAFERFIGCIYPWPDGREGMAPAPVPAAPPEAGYGPNGADHTPEDADDTHDGNVTPFPTTRTAHRSTPERRP